MIYKDITKSYASLTASSTYDTYTVTNILDDDSSTFWENNGNGGSIAFQFSKKYIITKILINLSTHCASMHGFTIDGSNDNISYTTIGSFSLQMQSTIDQLFILNNKNEYYYYRISLNTGSNWGELGNVKLFIDDIIFLIQDENNLCNTDGKILSTISIYPYAKEAFDNYGMHDLSMINKDIISLINNNKYNIAVLR